MVDEPDLFVDLCELMRAHGMDSPAIQAIVRELRRRWGGSRVYLPARDREVREAARADPDPPRVVAERYGVSPRTVRRWRDEWGL